jgi:hypothetical protein
MRNEPSLLSAEHAGTPLDPVGPSGRAKEAIWADFEFGFWHPFGQHGREGPSDILRRKRSEAERNGWTLWSFQYRTPQTLAAWRRELSSSSGPVLVFCSRGISAIDPDRPGGQAITSDCTRYCWPDDRKWRPIPELIRVPHPFGPGKRVASAFVVRGVHDLVERFKPLAIEWLSRGKWRADPLPTRPEYLIRRGGDMVMRDVRAILELGPPYLAVVGL